MEKKYFAVLVDGEEVETTIKSEYEEQAIDFLKYTNTTMKIERIDYRTDGLCMNRGSHFDYEITLKRNRKSWQFQFCDSVNAYKKDELPTAYDILACLQKYEVEEDFHDFCMEYGYEEYNENIYGRMLKNKEAQRIHKACLKEYKNVMRLFEDVIDELAEIQ